MQMKLWVYRWLEWGFTRLQTWSADMRMRVAYCDRCGRNRYHSPPCVGEGD